MRRALSTCLAVVALTGCMPPEAGPPDRLVFADGPAFTGSPAAVVEDLQRRATWVPSTSDFPQGAWVHGVAGIRARLGDRVQLSDLHGDAWSVDFELAGYGRGLDLQPTPVRATTAYGHQVTQDRGPVTEWYVNLGTKLEQGLELHEEPGGSGPVVLEFQVSGDLAPVLRDRAVVLVDGDGNRRARVDSLQAFDVDGDVVPAAMEASCDELGGCTVRYVLDDTHADWPLTVDPYAYAVFSPANPFPNPGYAGYAVDFSQDRVAVGIPGDPTASTVSGEVQILKRNGIVGDSWTIENTLNELANTFGRSVAIDGDVVVVGAPEADSAYVYEFDGSAWSATAEVLTSGAGDSFGAAVDISGDQIVVGAPAASSGAGAVFRFERTATDWASAVPTVHAGSAGQGLGSHLALDGYDLVAAMEATGEVALLRWTGLAFSQLALGDFSDGGTMPLEGVAIGGGLVAFSNPNEGDAGAPIPQDAVAVVPVTDLPAVFNDSAEFVQITAPPNTVDFGRRIATDGRTVAVASRLVTDLIGGPEAKVWLYEEQATGWALVADFPVALAAGLVPDVALNDGFLVIGEPGADGTNGDVAIFRREGTWEESWFLPSDGTDSAVTGSRAGAAVAVSGDRMAIGLPDDGIVAANAGRVILLERDPTASGWPNTGTLLADPNAGADQRYGAALSMEGQLLGVGAPGVLPAFGFPDGAAYLFDGTSVLLNEVSFGGEHAGAAVAVSDAYFAVGQPGVDEVVVFALEETGFGIRDTLSGGQGFGGALDIHDHWLVVGAPTADVPSVNAGSVSLWDLSGGTTDLVGTAQGAAAGERLGDAVALNSHTVFAGAPGAGGGEVRLFEAANGLATKGDISPNWTAGDDFGRSLATSGDRLVVGSLADRAQIRARNEGGPDAWGLEQEPISPDLVTGEQFGFAVAIDGPTVVVGAPERGSSRGRVFVYELDQQLDPVVNDDLVVVDEDTLAVFSVTANDYDPNGDVFTVTAGSTVSATTFDLSPDGTLTFLGSPDDFGQYAFTYTVDGFPTKQATVTIDLRSVNDPPTLDPPLTELSYDVDEGSAPFNSPGSVLDWVSDVDSPGPFTVQEETDVTRGVLNLFAEGNFEYTPEAGACDFEDSFQFRPDDGQPGGLGEPITVRLNVLCVNEPPTIQPPPVYPATVGAVLQVDAPGLLSDASDPDGDGVLVGALVVPPTAGVLAVFANGSFVYTPYAGAAPAADTFTFQVCDDNPLSACSDVVATLDFVGGPNTAPVVQDDAYVVPEDAGTVLLDLPNLLDNDTDPDGDTLTTLLDQQAAFGYVTMYDNGTFDYTPNGDFAGYDSFVYRASDGELTTPGTVTITVTPINDAPVPVDDTYDDVPRQGLIVQPSGVLGNDIDVDGDVLTAVLVTEPTDGRLTVQTDGSFHYIPDPDHLGVDTFHYRVSDGAVVSALTAEVTLITNEPTTGTSDTGIPEPCALWRIDRDGDGHGDCQEAPVELCESIAGMVPVEPNYQQNLMDGVPCTADCDDADPDVFPGADEIPNDKIDQDCNGVANTLSSPSTACATVSEPAAGAVPIAILALLLGWRRRRQGPEGARC